MRGNVQGLVAEISEVNELVSTLSQYHDDHPEDIAVAVNLASFRGAEQVLREELGAAIAREGGLEVDYRLYSISEIADEARSLQTVGSSYIAFQKAVTASYDAVVEGGNERYHPSLTSRESTKLYVATTFEGSFGSVLYTKRAPADLGGDLLNVSHLKSALEVIGAFVSANTPEQIRRLRQEHGSACVKSIAQWVKTQQENRIGSEAVLKVGDEVLSRFDLSEERLFHLEAVMGLATEARTRQETVSGRLFAVDIRNRRFSIEVDKRTIHGSIAERAEGYEPFQVPSYGTASLRFEEEDQLLADAVSSQVTLVRWSVDQPLVLGARV